MSFDRQKARRWWIAAAWLFAASPAWSAVCSGPSELEAKRTAHPGPQALIALGDWFGQHGQNACAVEVFQAAVHLEPRSPAALDGLARAYLASGDFGDAIQLLRGAPPSDVLTVDLATAYEKAGDTGQAGQTLVHAVRANPGSARLANALVLLMANHGQLDEAYKLADKFAKLHPHDPDAQKLFLRVLVATNDMAASRPLAKRLLTAAPSDGELLYLNGVLERKAGEFEAAKAHLQRSVAITPNFADSRYNLGLVLQQLGDEKGAAEQLQAAVALGIVDPEAHLHLSQALKRTGDTAGADQQMQVYQRGMQAKTNTDMASSKASDAEQALTQGDKTKAIALYREALEAKPRDPTLEYQLALALDAAGDTSNEQAALETAVQQQPTMALAQHQLGYLLFKNGDNQQAEQHFRQALKADPKFTQAWISLAATLATTSQFAAARDAVDHALRLDPHNSQAEQMKHMLPPAAAAR